MPEATVLAGIAWLKERVNRRVARLLWRRGWRPRLVPYTGYGAGPGAGAGDAGWVRVLARVLLAPPARDRSDQRDGDGAAEVRGWRRFLTVPLPAVPVQVEAGGCRHVVRSQRDGYVDVVLPSDLAGGWHEVRLDAADASPATGQVRVVGPEERLGVVSDIDDTVMVTAIPRPLLAFWNSFVRRESTRRPVPGMPEFLRRLRAEDTDCFVVYVSTGAWNVAPSVQRFLARHGYPAGPLLMTDWGPTPEAWFRSGRAHKHAALRRLLAELPRLQWALVGDDGQHDPQLYDDLVADAPGRVRLIAIRQLSRTEQVLTHGTPVPPDAQAPPHQPGVERVADVPRLHGPDGAALTRLLERHRWPADP